MAFEPNYYLLRITWEDSKGELRVLYERSLISSEEDKNAALKERKAYIKAMGGEVLKVSLKPCPESVGLSPL